jgi:hypothetical protein
MRRPSSSTPKQQNMKSLFILSIALLTRSSPPGTPDFIDPTGTYTLTGTVKNNRVTSHSGELRVRLIDRHKAAVCFYINKGYPGYESAAFLDTLQYEDNRLTYTPAQDTTCSVLFDFLPRAVEVIRLVSDPRCGCGFAPGVFIPATFDKSSNAIPVIQDLSAHGSPPQAG